MSPTNSWRLPHRPKTPARRSSSVGRGDWYGAFGLLIVLGLAAGCSDRRFAEVTGTVRLGGEPLAGAFIVFQPDTQGEVRGVGSTDQTGQYRILRPGGRFGAPRGPNTVSVHGGDSGHAVPPEYGTKSTLRCDVRPGKNTFDIEIPGR